MKIGLQRSTAPCKDRRTYADLRIDQCINHQLTDRRSIGRIEYNKLITSEIIMRLSRHHAALAAAYLGTFLASLDISIVNVALPTMQSALHTDIAGLQWVINAYAICLSAFMLCAGPLADRYGHKRAWLCGLVLFTSGSVLCGMAPNLVVLLTGRAIQGGSAALLISGAMPILSHAFPDARQRAHVIGGWSAFSALSLILGPLLGGILLEWLGW